MMIYSGDLKKRNHHKPGNLEKLWHSIKEGNGYEKQSLRAGGLDTDSLRTISSKGLKQGE
jgi:hypothetical protein